MSDLDRRAAMKLGLAGVVAAGAGWAGPAAAAAAQQTSGSSRSAVAGPARTGEPLMQVSNQPSLVWLEQIVATALSVRSNTDAVIRSGRWTFARSPEPTTLLTPTQLMGWAMTGQTSQLLNFFAPSVGPVTGGEVVHSLEGYRALFATPMIAPTPIHDSFLSEATFGEAFVAGVDPTRLTRMNAIPAKFPINSAHLGTVPELGATDLNAALNAGRVYWIDYELTAGLPDFAHHGIPKYMYSPMVALCVPADGGAPRAFAIQCGQDPALNQVYTPADGYSWKIARNCVFAAHNTVHEALTHLGQAHWVVESMIKAAVNTLPAKHPLAPLLSQHFAGTLFINSVVPNNLTNPGGWFDELSGTPVTSLMPWIDEQLSDYSFRDNYLPTRLSQLATHDTRALPHYPYRDDGLLLWTAISTWITDFVGVFYPSDEAVRTDVALQAFASAVVLKDFGRTPGEIADRQDLVEILTMILWTAGPFHAAINFSQKDWLGFLPGGPLGGFTPEPQGTGHTEQDWLNNLPSVDVALVHIAAMWLLTAVRDSTLGHYGSTFSLTPAATAARRFRDTLTQVEREITGRNRQRSLPYTYLLPSKIPQSISI